MRCRRKHAHGRFYIDSVEVGIKFGWMAVAGSMEAAALAESQTQLAASSSGTAFEATEKALLAEGAALGKNKEPVSIAMATPGQDLPVLGRSVRKTTIKPG
jgi:hypothetical protein